MKTLKNKLTIVLLSIVTLTFAQHKEMEFEVYTTSASKASRYLLGDDVALRDCPSTFCTQLTTIAIGTNIRLLAKSTKPETLNGITSRWYKIQMGPQVGWIWGGLIAQAVVSGSVDHEMKFLIGEAGVDHHSNQQYQIRAVKNGVELDRFIFKANSLDYAQVKVQAGVDGQEIIQLATMDGIGIHLIWKDGSLQLQLAHTTFHDSQRWLSNGLCVE